MIQLKERVEKTVGYPISDALWRWLQEEGYVDDAERANYDLTEIVEAVRDIIGPSRQPAKTDAFLHPLKLIPAADQLHERSEAISAWFARAANTDSAAQRFRNQALNGTLLHINDVHEWVVRVEEQERPSPWITDEAPTTDPDVVMRVAQQARFSRQPHLLFRWIEGSDNGLEGAHWPVSKKGTLADAQLTCDKLSEWWDWDVYDTMLWLLTGQTPYVWPVKASGRFGPNFVRDMGVYDVHSRITVSVDPAITPEQLAKWWRDVRHQVLEKKYRPLSIKHLRLAKFAASLEEEERWDDSRQRWNREHCGNNPEWKYDDKRNFHRDINYARSRLLFMGTHNPNDQSNHETRLVAGPQ